MQDVNKEEVEYDLDIFETILFGLLVRGLVSRVYRLQNN